MLCLSKNKELVRNWAQFPGYLYAKGVEEYMANVKNAKLKLGRLLASVRFSTVLLNHTLERNLIMQRCSVSPTAVVLGFLTHCYL